jgi:stage III sporulation protein AF
LLDIISDLVRNIALIILLTVFIEMLLPKGDMARYIQLIMGLFIIIVIFNPIMTFLSNDEVFENSLWKFSGGEINSEDILAQGEEINKINHKEAMEGYRYRVERQIEAVSMLVPEVNEVKAEVVLNDKDKTYLGYISKITLWVVLENEENKKNENEDIYIDPIKIEDEVNEKESIEMREDTTLNTKVSQRLKDTLCNFYGIDKKDINVFWKSTLGVH